MSLLIDGGYLMHYRFYATVQWWNFARKGEEIGERLGDFQTAFNDQFIKFYNDFVKTHKLDKTGAIVALDSPRANIWRTKIFPGYKAGRTVKDKLRTAINVCFSRENLLTLYQKLELRTVEHPELEADDCIAILVRHNRVPLPVTIITSDHDYIQLCTPQISLLTLKGTPLVPAHSPSVDLLAKIVGGDKSDAIPPLFKRCGPKTAMTLAQNPDKLAKKVASFSEEEKVDYIKNREQNTTLIDMSRIPKRLVEEFLASLQ